MRNADLRAALIVGEDSLKGVNLRSGPIVLFAAQSAIRNPQSEIADWSW